MMIKYRVHEVAKDLGVASKDIIALLKDYLGQEKKHMTALSEDELNLIFEYYTQKNQEENFDRYFASKDVAENVEGKSVKSSPKKLKKAEESKKIKETSSPESSAEQNSNNKTKSTAKSKEQNKKAAKNNKPKFENKIINTTNNLI